MSLYNLFKSTANDDSSQEGRRPLTRSQSREAPSHLTIESSAISSFNGVARGRRSPSPRPIGHNANSAVIFQYDSTNVSQQLLNPQQQQDDAERFEDSRTDARPIMSTDQRSIEQLRAAAAAAVEAANAATSALAAAANLVSSQGQQQSIQPIRTRKPDLPEFDSKNIEVWIRRVSSAYDRAGIALPKDKFAFLESKFAVGANPAIDAFLYGPATEEAWTAFLQYLREEYGRTIQQEAQFLRGQFSRDGRKPTQMLAHLKDKTRRVSVDDILKEIIVSSLPQSVQQMILERVKDMTSEEAAAVADRYFDQDGRPLHSSSSSINQVDSPQAEATRAGDDYDDDEDFQGADVNAIRGRRGGGRGGYRGNNSRSFKPHNNNNFNRREGGHTGPPSGATRPFNGRGGQHRTPPSASSAHPASASSSKAPITCMSHQRYGDKSYTCQQGCSLWQDFQRRQSGKANAGKRQ